jgi:Holliday junction resolvasome RuvABC DNA-binding subunit
MYDYISGKVSELTPSYVIIENMEIGYFVNISLFSYSELTGKESLQIVYTSDNKRRCTHFIRLQFEIGT